MSDYSRRTLRHGHAYAFLMASVALAALAPVAHAQTTDGTALAAEAGDNSESADIVVIGSGQTRSVSTLLPANPLVVSLIS